MPSNNTHKLPFEKDIQELILHFSALKYLIRESPIKLNRKSPIKLIEKEVIGINQTIADNILTGIKKNEKFSYLNKVTVEKQLLVKQLNELSDKISFNISFIQGWIAYSINDLSKTVDLNSMDLNSDLSQVYARKYVLHLKTLFSLSLTLVTLQPLVDYLKNYSKVKPKIRLNFQKDKMALLPITVALIATLNVVAVACSGQSIFMMMPSLISLLYVLYQVVLYLVKSNLFASLNIKREIPFNLNEISPFFEKGLEIICNEKRMVSLSNKTNEKKETFFYRSTASNHFNDQSCERKQELEEHQEQHIVKEKIKRRGIAFHNMEIEENRLNHEDISKPEISGINLQLISGSVSKNEFLLVSQKLQDELPDVFLNHINSPHFSKNGKHGIKIMGIVGSNVFEIKQSSKDNSHCRVYGIVISDNIKKIIEYYHLPMNSQLFVVTRQANWATEEQVKQLKIQLKNLKLQAGKIINDVIYKIEESEALAKERVTEENGTIENIETMRLSSI